MFWTAVLGGSFWPSGPCCASNAVRAACSTSARSGQVDVPAAGRWASSTKRRSANPSTAEIRRNRSRGGSQVDRSPRSYVTIQSLSLASRRPVQPQAKTDEHVPVNLSCRLTLRTRKSRSVPPRQPSVGTVTANTLAATKRCSMPRATPVDPGRFLHHAMGGAEMYVCVVTGIGWTVPVMLSQTAPTASSSFDGPMTSTRSPLWSGFRADCG